MRDLLYIMRDLGIPPDIICVIADRYTHAMTKVNLYFAKIDPVAIKTGTVQEDTLFPLTSGRHDIATHQHTGERCSMPRYSKNCELLHCTATLFQ